MEHSQELDKLAEALAQAQAEIKPAQMNATNPFLKNKYADLGSVIDAVKPAMIKHGLAVTQLPSGDGETISITTMLLHTSGQFIRSTISLPVGSEKGRSLAQSAGAIITYLRRYGLAAMLSVYADEDTDGGNPAKKAAKRNGNQEQRQQLDPEELERLLSKKVKGYAGNTASEKQRSLFYGVFAGMFQNTEGRHMTQAFLFGVESMKDINDPQVLAALDWLKPEKVNGKYQANIVAANEALAVLRQVQAA